MPTLFSSSSAAATWQTASNARGPCARRRLAVEHGRSSAPWPTCTGAPATRDAAAPPPSAGAPGRGGKVHRRPHRGARGRPPGWPALALADSDPARVPRRLGVVHRDIKPSNLVMSSSMDLGTLRIVDFGSAVQISARDAAFPREVCGTVGFMAPELTQWPDRSHGLAGRACFPGTNMRVGGVCSTGVDVWSAGVCLYLMLVGRPPFSLGKNPCAARDAKIWSATAETARQFMNGDPWRCAEWMELSGERRRQPARPGTPALPGKPPP